MSNSGYWWFGSVWSRAQQILSAPVNLEQPCFFLVCPVPQWPDISGKLHPFPFQSAQVAVLVPCHPDKAPTGLILDHAPPAVVV